MCSSLIPKASRWVLTGVEWILTILWNVGVDSEVPYGLELEDYDGYWESLQKLVPQRPHWKDFLNSSGMVTELLNLVAYPIVVGGFWKSRSNIAVLIEVVSVFRKAGVVLGGLYLNSRYASSFWVRFWFLHSFR